MADIEINLDVECSICHVPLTYTLSEKYGSWTVSVDPCEACLQKSAEKGVC